jgi:phage terminase large subunit-like protein
MQSGNGRNSTEAQPPITTAGNNLHSAWLQFMRYCAELRHGEIEKLKIQDGLPMIAEMAVKKIKFAP